MFLLGRLGVGVWEWWKRGFVGARAWCKRGNGCVGHRGGEESWGEGR